MYMIDENWRHLAKFITKKYPNSVVALDKSIASTAF